MARRLRFLEAEAIHFITVRTRQRRLFLRPDSEVAGVLGGVLAKAAALYGIELFAFVALSNHVHLLCRSRDGRIPGFMKYLLGNASRKIGCLVDWSGGIWGSRYSAQPVLDDAALEDRLRYILSHGVKEHLVEHPADWTGLSCLPQLVGDPCRTFTFHRWSERWKGGRLLPGRERPDSPDIAEQVTLEVRPLPHWASLSRDERRQRVEAIVDNIATEHRGFPKVGMKRVLERHPHEQPAPKPRTRQPWCHTTDETLREEFMAKYRAFAEAFSAASRRFHGGELTVAFPLCSCRPPLPVTSPRPQLQAA